MIMKFRQTFFELLHPQSDGRLRRYIGMQDLTLSQRCTTTYLIIYIVELGRELNEYRQCHGMTANRVFLIYQWQWMMNFN